MKIVFMGTPQFAVESLDAILKKSNQQVVAVYTQPDKPFGRNKILKLPDVKIKAIEKNLLVKQPLKFDETEIEFLKSLNPDVIVVVAYGKILPKEVLKIPKFGCVNIHASLLPKYRGASPVQTSIICGEKITGVTAIFLSEKLDAGDIIGVLETEIEENETAITLFEKLSHLGSCLLCDVLKKIEEGSIVRQVQDEKLATYAPILKKEMGRINFKKPAMVVHKLICGLNPWPGAFCLFNNRILKVYRSVVLKNEFQLKPAEILNSKRFIVGCGDGAIEFLHVQLQGRKQMDGTSFLNGSHWQGKSFENY